MPKPVSQALFAVDSLRAQWRLSSGTHEIWHRPLLTKRYESDGAVREFAQLDGARQEVAALIFRTSGSTPGAPSASAAAFTGTASTVDAHDISSSLVMAGAFSIFNYRLLEKTTTCAW